MLCLCWYSLYENRFISSDILIAHLGCCKLTDFIDGKIKKGDFTEFAKNFSYVIFLDIARQIGNEDRMKVFWAGRS